MTYGDLSKLVDHPAHFLGKPLAYVRDDICARHNLPLLTVLVVDAATGLPGDSFLPGGRGDLSDEQYREIVDEHSQRVFEYDRWEQTWENLTRHYGYEE